MTRPPTAAQRRVLDAADPVTGRLRATPAQLAALVRHGLAFRHPRPPHDHFLTPAGHRLREAEPAAPPPEPTGVFAARVGGEEQPPPAGPARVREVHSAWQGLLELRRMTNPGGAVDRPCGWERSHLVRAAALALEAAGHRPADGADGADGPGYRVRATPQPEAVAVHEPDAEALRACGATLEEAGWQAGEHTEPRTRVRYLLASPRRA
ncbi:hypothetical protein ACWC10_07595 [Streptomyces sp. NPDC001595]|uniref:hypothetical protein n=1 Tax=Streptomyces sp. NPDC001532 TaxID=3154520 RepID=UPI00333224D5